jgi:uroporphyrinogen-III decarboxylase
MEYARRHSDLPVGMTDLNSPLSTAAQMCGYENLFIWMYDEPNAVHDLLSVVTDSFIAWVKAQKDIAGEPLNQSNGLQGWWSPEGIGVWLSDDDIVTISPELYEEFVVPQYSKIFETFGGGCLHFCGNAANHADAMLKIKNLRAVNNSIMLGWDGFEKLAAKLSGKVMMLIQDIAYVDMEDFLANMFTLLGDLRGVMIAAFAQDNTAKTKQGEDVYINRSAHETSNKAVSLARTLAAKKLMI